MNRKVYVHYGHKKFDEKLFEKIKNRNFVKPIGGLWASDVNAKYGWKNWCEDEKFRECIESNSFKFKLRNNAKILVINNAEQLKKLPIEECIYKLPWINLDFEKLTKNYDGIEVIISDDSKLYFDLYGWDCDSILIFNKECIEECN